MPDRGDFVGYGLEYYEHMLRHYPATAEQVCAARWKWIERTTNFKPSNRSRVLLDWGSGLGFMRVYSRPGWEVYTYDKIKVPQTGRPQGKAVDVLTLYDVIEHVADPMSDELLRVAVNEAVYVVISVPILPRGVHLFDWKHYKPMEHLHYFSEHAVCDWMNKQSKYFRCLASGQPECPPRQDVWTFTFTKRSGDGEVE